MRKILVKFFLLFILSSSIMAQDITVFDIDASTFPEMKAKCFVVDDDGTVMSNLSNYTLILKEDRIERQITNINCPAPQPSQPISAVLTVDLSGSMCGRSMDILKAAATTWLKLLPLGTSECAITGFESDNFFISDFSHNRAELINSIQSLNCNDGTDFDAAFIDRSAGALRVAEQGKYKKVVVLFTDGFASGNQEEIIEKANDISATVYCVTVDNPTPDLLKEISKKTGGMYFDNVTTEKQAEDIYKSILMFAQGGDPCEIEWISGGCPTKRKAELSISDIGLMTDFSYSVSYDKLPKLKFSPSASIKFGIKESGKTYTEKISITAQVEPVNVKSIISSNPKMTIIDYGGTNPPFSLLPGETRELRIEFSPDDSSYAFSRFEIESNSCYGKYFYVSGGDIKKKSLITQNIKIVFPNGGEELVAGSDTTITWEGVSPADYVKLEYTIDDGKNWNQITDTASGLAYRWRVPNYPSNKVWVRATAKAMYEEYTGCENDVEICGKIWMGCNLNVDRYRNGDPIPEVKDTEEWENLKTGAWCYYNNDPANGEIYGKLYNWYAVNDPRGLAPEGWHVPTDEEWKELEMCLGMSRSEADKEYERGSDQGAQLAGEPDLWTFRYEDEEILMRNKNFDKTGFSAVPGGYRFNIFGWQGGIGYWWTATESDDTLAWERGISSSKIGRRESGKACGNSVRCVRD